MHSGYNHDSREFTMHLAALELCGIVGGSRRWAQQTEMSNQPANLIFIGSNLLLMGLVELKAIESGQCRKSRDSF